MAELTFESAMERLEIIVKKLEEGSEPLDSSLGLYEEGVKLVRFCSKALDTAEQRVKILTGDGNTMTAADFNEKPE